MAIIMKEGTTLVFHQVAGVILGSILVTALLFEVYVNVLPDLRDGAKTLSYRSFGLLRGFSEFISKVRNVLKDYSSGRYYKPWNNKNVTVLTSLDHLRELSDAPQLSQRAVYADIFGFRHTMAHLDTGLDPNEQVPHRYRLFGTAIRSIGVSQLQELHPYLQAALDRTMTSTVDSSPAGADGWRTVTLAPLMRDAATGLLGTYFFGESIFSEPSFHKATYDFYQDVMRCMAALQVAPTWSHGPIYRYLTNNGKALQGIFERLRKAIDNPNGWQEDDRLKSLTLLYHLIDQTRNSDYWTTDLLIQAVVGIWFAASHQPWINLHFVMLELCDRPEYTKALKEEIRSLPDLEFDSIQKLPLLDSFIKECVRLNPLDRMAIRRKALSTYKFSNGGPVIPKNGIACISAWDIMHDPTRYPQPDEFDGFRFVGKRAGLDTRGTTFTDASKDFPVWGFGARVW